MRSPLIFRCRQEFTHHSPQIDVGNEFTIGIHLLGRVAGFVSLLFVNYNLLYKFVEDADVEFLEFGILPDQSAGALIQKNPEWNMLALLRITESPTPAPKSVKSSTACWLNVKLETSTSSSPRRSSDLQGTPWPFESDPASEGSRH